MQNAQQKVKGRGHMIIGTRRKPNIMTATISKVNFPPWDSSIFCSRGPKMRIIRAINAKRKNRIPKAAAKKTDQTASRPRRRQSPPL